MTSIIEAIANRGALRPQELTLVGAVYEKITAILNKVKDENKGNKDA
jgi:hypothetical protein